MGFLSGLLRSQSGGLDATLNPGDPRFWYLEDLGIQSLSGEPVSATSSMRVATVNACVRVLSEDIAKVPLHVFRRIDEQEREKATTHPWYTPLHSKPNRWQTAFEWREMMMAHVLLRGNAYSEIVRTRTGNELIPRNPDRIRVVPLDNGTLRYVWTQTGGGEKKIDQADMWHLRGRSSDGVTGDSVVAQMRDTVGLAQATEKHGSRIFRNAMQTPLIFKHPGAVKPETFKMLRADLKEKYAGAGNAGETMLLEEGMSVEKMGLTNEDSQFLETREFSVVEIARFFRMPPHKVMHLKNATFSNIEQQEISYVVDTLLPWTVRFESVCGRDLIAQPGKFFVEFMLQGLLRGDAAARSAYYKSGIHDGWLNRNEVRRLENMNPGPPELDEYLEPMNMRVAGEEPPAPAAPPPPEEDEDDEDDDDQASAPQSPAAAVVLGTARKFVRQEIARISKYAPRYSRNADGWQSWLESFYESHAKRLESALGITKAQALDYCQSQMAEIASHGLNVLETWESEKGAQLFALVTEAEQ